MRVKHKASIWLKRLGRHPLMREGAPLLGLYWLYSLVRWAIAYDSPAQAFANAYRVIGWHKYG